MLQVPNLGDRQGLDLGSILLICGAIFVGLPLLGELLKPAAQGAPGSKNAAGTIRAAPVTLNT